MHILDLFISGHTSHDYNSTIDSIEVISTTRVQTVEGEVELEDEDGQSF